MGLSTNWLSHFPHKKADRGSSPCGPTKTNADVVEWVDTEECLLGGMGRRIGLLRQFQGAKRLSIKIRGLNGVPVRVRQEVPKYDVVSRDNGKA